MLLKFFELEARRTLLDGGGRQHGCPGEGLPPGSVRVEAVRSAIRSVPMESVTVAQMDNPSDGRKFWRRRTVRHQHRTRDSSVLLATSRRSRSSSVQHSISSSGCHSRFIQHSTPPTADGISVIGR